MLKTTTFAARVAATVRAILTSETPAEQVYVQMLVVVDAATTDDAVVPDYRVQANVVAAVRTARRSL